MNASPEAKLGAVKLGLQASAEEQPSADCCHPTTG